MKLRGVILQSDKTSAAGAWIIRPVEMLDLHLAGIGRSPEAPPLAMHAGLHVVLEDDREFVVEQLLGDPREDFVDGLNWTPLETFRKRDHRGWDLTVPATKLEKRLLKFRAHRLGGRTRTPGAGTRANAVRLGGALQATPLHAV